MGRSWSFSNLQFLGLSWILSQAHLLTASEQCDRSKEEACSVDVRAWASRLKGCLAVQTSCLFGFEGWMGKRSQTKPRSLFIVPSNLFHLILFRNTLQVHSLFLSPFNSINTYTLSFLDIIPMNSLYNHALKQVNTLQRDLDKFQSGEDTSVALQGILSSIAIILGAD